MNDSKYEKRRRQQFEQSRFIFMIILICSFILCGFYAQSKQRTVSSTKKENNERDNNYNNEHEKISTSSLRKKITGRLYSQPHIKFLEKEGNPESRSLENLKNEVVELEKYIQHNVDTGIRWVDTRLLPKLPIEDADEDEEAADLKEENFDSNKRPPRNFFSVGRRHRYRKMDWEFEMNERQRLEENRPRHSLYIDFSQHPVTYPKTLHKPPILGDYPERTTLEEIFKRWPQDDIDEPPNPFQDYLMHFDTTIPDDVEAAKKFLDANLPFKAINVPEVLSANHRWTDEYLRRQFDVTNKNSTTDAKMSGTCFENRNNFFLFFMQAYGWNVAKHGLPPLRTNDLTFETCRDHATYADTTGLNASQPHFYWQSDREIRYRHPEDLSFIGRDLSCFTGHAPSKSSRLFMPEQEQFAGIHCRFTERGSVLALQLDSNKEMVAVVNGSMRYLLIPPIECPKLGMTTDTSVSILWQSALNLGHISYLDCNMSSSAGENAARKKCKSISKGMPSKERKWLDRAKTVKAIETIVRPGEVLFIPSNWMRYSITLQKSAACSLISLATDYQGDTVFGGEEDVFDCGGS